MGVYIYSIFSLNQALLVNHLISINSIKYEQLKTHALVEINFQFS